MGRCWPARELWLNSVQISSHVETLPCLMWAWIRTKTASLLRPNCRSMRATLESTYRLSTSCSCSQRIWNALSPSLRRRKRHLNPSATISLRSLRKTRWLCMSSLRSRRRRSKRIQRRLKSLSSSRLKLKFRWHSKSKSMKSNLVSYVLKSHNWHRLLRATSKSKIKGHLNKALAQVWAMKNRRDFSFRNSTWIVMQQVKQLLACQRSQVVLRLTITVRSIQSVDKCLSSRS